MTSCQFAARSQAYSSTNSVPCCTAKLGLRLATGGRSRAVGRVKPCMVNLVGTLLAHVDRKGGGSRGRSAPLGLKSECDPVHAVPEPGGRWPVREHVSKMRVAARAAYLGALEE